MNPQRSVIGYRLLAIGYRPWSVGYRLLAIGYRPWSVGYRPLAIGYCFLAVGYWLLAICYALAEAPTVGMEGRLEIALPGARLEAKPLDPKAPCLVRVADALPRGSLTQYDLRYTGLVPGSYDLRTNLVRVDGSTTSDLPPMRVEVRGLLPKPHSGELEVDAQHSIPLFGSYRRLMIALAAGWASLLVPILFVGRHRRRAAAAPPPPHEPTLAERLRPLVEQAAAGTLSPDGQAQLERMLLTHWRHRLQVEELDMIEAVGRLRAHPEAGALLRELENWLHRRPGQSSVNIEAVLAPYRQR